MDKEQLLKIIEYLVPASAAEKLKEVMENITVVQQSLYNLATSEDSDQLNLLKIGTAFQIFFVDILASGKDPKSMTGEDWKDLAVKVLHNAVLEKEQSYSAFVFRLYADYIDVSASILRRKISEKSSLAIAETASEIRRNTDLLCKGKMTEADYIDECLWLSLEGMIKLLSASLAFAVGKDLADLALAVSQLAFEYGRYVYYVRERKLLERYLENQRILDEKLQHDYETFIMDVRAEAERFSQLIDEAFSPNLHEALLQSAALARAAGVKEEDVLKTVDDVDAFFLE